MKIALIRKYIFSIWRECLDYSATQDQVASFFLEPQERTIFDLIKNDGLIEAAQNLIPSGFNFSNIKARKNPNSDMSKDQSIIIVLNWIGSCIQTCHFPSSRRVALEML